MRKLAFLIIMFDLGRLATSILIHLMNTGVSVDWASATCLAAVSAALSLSSLAGHGFEEKAP